MEAGTTLSNLKYMSASFIAAIRTELKIAGAVLVI